MVEFNCPQCHAQTAYSATDGGLTCTHCGYYKAPSQAVVGKGAEEFEFTVETMAKAAQGPTAMHGWGLSRKELQCQNCGAELSVPLDSLTHTCPFCASNRVIQREDSQEVLRPRFVVPFKIEAQACQATARQFLGDSWFVPKTLRDRAMLDQFSGLYLPFWTFDATTAAKWKAEVAHQVEERYFEARELKFKTRKKTVWKWESGHASLPFDDVPLCGTTRLSQYLLASINQFDLGDLARYEAE